MIDFHCHIDLYPNPSNIIADCEKQGLYVLSLTTTPSAWKITNALAEGKKRIRTALGLHPQLAYERKRELNLFNELVKQVNYVGEIGLDGSPEFRQYWDDQIYVFKNILATCKKMGGKIMSIHSRRASNEVLDCLYEYKNSGIPILHWFSGSVSDLDRAIELRCWFSVGPNMLKGKKGQSLCSKIPRDRILTETDGPFVMINNRPIMPWELDETIEILSSL